MVNDNDIFGKKTPQRAAILDGKDEKV